jgi:hypothetical protein
MLPLVIPETELYDEVRNEFIFVKQQKLVLEHSLLSLSKWESKWHKPFLSKKEKTEDEIFDYIRCMTVNSVDENVYLCLSQEMVNQINKYIEDSMTATTINDKRSPSREIVTAEIIYYWMVALQIPFECQKWHLNRLLTLIDVCSIKNQPPKKMSQKAILARNASLNAARRRALHSKG